MQLLLLTFAGGHIIIYQSNTVTMVWGPPVGGPPGPNEFGMPPHRFRPAHSREGDRVVRELGNPMLEEVVNHYTIFDYEIRPRIPMSLKRGL